MPKTAAAPKDRIDIDWIVDTFSLPDWEGVEESNVDFIGESGVAAYGEAVREGADEEEALKRQDMAEREAATELWSKYHGAVMDAAEEILGLHHLELEPVRRRERYPFEYRVRPASGKTWEDAARQLAQTIIGVGMVDVPAEEWARAPRRFVLDNLRAVRHYPEVYGTERALDIYGRGW